MDRPLGAAPAFGGSWARLNSPLTPWILDVIHKMGFQNMTPVQASTIPRAVKNQDCVVEAVTGSGKTLAYVVPVLERICRRERPYRKGEIAAIVIAPTRELATQINEVFHHFLSSLTPPQASSSTSRSPSPHPDAPYPLPLCITSGTPAPYETFVSQSPNILVGTPGRLASFLLSPRGMSLVRVGEFDVLILDEADRLLSSADHRRDVERIMKHLPKQRRTHLFSATMTDAVEEMVGLGLRNPVRIVVNLKDKRVGEETKERRTPTGLQNTVLICRHAEKTLQLVRLLQHESLKHEAGKFIVYFSTCAAVDYFYRILSKLPALSKFHLTSLHGDLPTRIRTTALSTFTSHPSSHLAPAVLLCTDVAARGVDFADIDVVIQYDTPTDPKTFSHRAGRTARAGRRGKAVVLLGKGREEDYVDFLSVRKIPLTSQPYINESLDEAESPSTLDPGAVELQQAIRKTVSGERELADKAAKAFVSALRAYSKHEASFIFRMADLDFYSLAMAYGLLRLPAMPEIKDWKKKREKREVAAKAEGAPPVPEIEEVVPWEEAEIDWDNFAYASKQRETARLASLESKKQATEAERKKRKIKAEMREAWSEQKDKKIQKEERRSRKDMKKKIEWERAQAEGGEMGMVEAFKAKKGIKLGSAAGIGMKREAGLDGESGSEDERDLVNDYRLLKREAKEERAGKRAKKENPEMEVGTMFDGLE